MQRPINFRNGFFRIWVVLSAGWVLLVGALMYSDIASPQLGERFYVLPGPDARFFELQNYFDQFDVQFKAKHWKIEFPNNVILYATNDVSEPVARERSAEFYSLFASTRESEVVAARWRALGRAFGVSLVPPLVLLLVGVMLGWIAAGFRRSH
jgi:hypothetical protein